MTEVQDIAIVEDSDIVDSDIMEGESEDLKVGEERELQRVRNSSELIDWIRSNAFNYHASELLVLIENHLETLSDALPEPERRRVRYLGEIAARTLELENAKSALDRAVAEARNWGATWEAIGAAAGITMQSAHRRWDAEARRKNIDAQRRRRSMLDSMQDEIT